MGRVGVAGGVGAVAGRDRRSRTRSLSSAGTGAAGSTGRGGTVVAPATGVGAGSTGAWVVCGSGTTTGPTEGVGRNGVLVSGSALFPTVAEPALIAARIGIDAVPASSATVSR
ncbi:hypothetical protein [Micromonospora sp. WMMA1996]|uniref:hypothetical protein n=1 Tax=Micromonospora sp. WMMA1996 TaxID=2039878 RepID=UPI0020D27F91|nr:hypothetical protein [Micromonospora sp. WMMA1996]